MPVVVVNGAFFSRAAELVSYAAPTLVTITGCPGPVGGTDVPGHTTECPRESLTPIVITGLNLGLVRGVVLVGGAPCLGVAHTANREHEQITCQVPRGTGSERSVWFIQDRGVISQNSLLLSYQPCAPGTFQANPTDLFCTDCPAGRISTSFGQEVCLECGDGFVAGTAGLTECTACPKGFFSSRADGPLVNCTGCPVGRFNSATGQAVCERCPAGRAANLTGQEECALCARGTANAAVEATECTPCAAGTIADEEGSLVRLCCEHSPCPHSCSAGVRCL